MVHIFFHECQRQTHATHGDWWAHICRGCGECSSEANIHFHLRSKCLLSVVSWGRGKNIHLFYRSKHTRWKCMFAYEGTGACPPPKTTNALEGYVCFWGLTPPQHTQRRWQQMPYRFKQWRIWGVLLACAPQGSRFFHFDIQIFWNVAASGVGAPTRLAPPTGNPGSVTVKPCIFK